MPIKIKADGVWKQRILLYYVVITRASVILSDLINLNKSAESVIKWSAYKDSLIVYL